MLHKTIFYRQISYFLLAALLLPQTAFASFTDVPSTHIQYEAISILEKQGVIKGYPDGTFHPEQLVTRAELLKMIFTHIGYKPGETIAETKFTDVPSGSWFAVYVRKALELGVININPDVPKFFPDQPITRIEALKIIMPLEGIPAPYLNDNTPLIFDDVNPDAPYSYLVRAAQNAGLYSSYNGRYFYPYRNLTRGETAELLYRAQIFRESQGQTTNFLDTDIYNQLNQEEIDLINNPKFPIFISVWTKINQQYYDQDNLDQNQLIYGAVDGMVESLEDPYSVFEQPATAGAIEDSLEGTFEGIGTILNVLDGQFIIISVLKDSPAEQAGILPGDVIKKVDGKDITGLSVDEVISLIKGPAGTEVTLTILRDTQTLEFTMIRAEITLDSIIIQQSQVTVPENIGYIAIYQFTSSTGNDFETVLQQTMAKNPKGLIIDLRDNPGGYLNSTYEVLNHFIPKDKAVINLKIAGRVIEHLSDGPGELSNTPMVILVNNNTASAAEVMAGAIQDYQLGKLVGEQTYGKGTVQEVTTYSDGSFFKLTIAYWLTALKNDINHIGLTPDITVALTKDDLLNNNDPQLEKAIQLLSN